MSERVTVEKINTMPEVDPYHANTGQQAAVSFWLDPQNRRCGIDSDYDTGGMDASVYHNRTYNIRLAVSPDQDAAREYLESEQGQSFLACICDGHSVDWDGHNMIGSLTEEADEALEILIDELDNLPESEWLLWDVGDWLNQAELDITTETTDEQIAELAAQLEQYARDEHVVVAGDIAGYLTSERDWLRDTT